MNYITALMFITATLANANNYTIFEKWVSQYNKMFNNLEEYIQTYNNWVDNDNFITNHNSLKLTYQLGHGPFSGMNNQQYRAYLMDRNIDRTHNKYYRNIEKPVDSLPSTIDWSLTGSVSDVKDQGQCGSCWSFSTTGALEGAYFMRTGNSMSFSEQQLVDCDIITNGGSELACKGGFMDSAFSWIQSNGGLCSESDYPYTSGTTLKAGSCKKCQVVPNSNIKSYVDIQPSNDNALMSVLVNQPVSIAIEADQREFQLYKSGVFTGTCGTTLDHGVLVVGYGTLNGVDYYKVKNSWSSTWGLDGYILLGRGTNPTNGKTYNNGDGQCGMLLEASFPPYF